VFEGNNVHYKDADKFLKLNGGNWSGSKTGLDFSTVDAKIESFDLRDK